MSKSTVVIPSSGNDVSGSTGVMVNVTASGIRSTAVPSTRMLPGPVVFTSTTLIVCPPIGSGHSETAQLAAGRLEGVLARPGSVSLLQAVASSVQAASANGPRSRFITAQ